MFGTPIHTEYSQVTQRTKGAEGMALEETRRTWERFKSAELKWEDPEPMVELHSESFTLNDGEVNGRDALRQFEQALRWAFPDWKREYLEAVIGENAVAFRWCAQATHLGNLFGHEPTRHLHACRRQRADCRKSHPK